MLTLSMTIWEEVALSALALSALALSNLFGAPSPMPSPMLQGWVGVTHTKKKGWVGRSNSRPAMQPATPAPHLGQREY